MCGFKIPHLHFLLRFLIFVSVARRPIPIQKELALAFSRQKGVVLTLVAAASLTVFANVVQARR